MLKLLNTKLLIAILAVLATIASTALYQRHEAALQKQQDEAFRKRVEQLRKQHSSAAGNESKTWTTYLP
jgi:hypothetical protein